MDRNSEPVKFWHVCGPLLLYWVIQFVAQLVAELAVMIPHIGQVMDYDALEKSTFFSAVLLSSLIFGLMNGNLLQILYVGAMGMVLAYSYEICGTIKVPILLHITVNVMGILLTDSALGAWIQGDIMRLGGAVIVSAFVGSSMYVLLRGMKKQEVPPVE